jgi:hypothetical protein
VLRPYLLARRENLSAAAAFATVIVERLLDLCTVLLLFALALVLVPAPIRVEVKVGGVFLAAVGAGGLVALFVLAGHPDRLQRWMQGLTQKLPHRAGAAVAQFARTFSQGLKVMRTPRHLAFAMGWSVLLWTSIAASTMCTSWAFDLTVPPLGWFLVVGYLTVGVSAPTPGAAGGFELAYKLALELFYRDPARAAHIGAAAIALHFVSMAPVALAGLLFMWQDGLTLGRLKGMRAEAQAAEEITDPPT